MRRNRIRGTLKTEGGRFNKDPDPHLAACLVTMAEMNPKSLVFTYDHHFNSYRASTRRTIGLKKMIPSFFLQSCLRILLIVLGSAVGLTLKAEAENPSQSNIVFIIADDLTFQDVGCYGGKNVATPHIDSIGEEEIFDEALNSAASVCKVSPVSSVNNRRCSRMAAYKALFESAVSHNSSALNKWMAQAAEFLN